MTTPAWLVKVGTQEQAPTQTKLSKASSSESNKDKKQKPSRHVRARAKLPTGPDRAHYNFPDWVTQDSFKQMMMVVLKTLSNSQQRLRIIEAVVADNFVVPTDIAPVTCAITQAEAYHKAAISGNDTTDMGPPGPQVLYAFCEAMQKLDIGESPRIAVREHIIDKLKTLPQHRCSEIAAVFSIRACFDPSFHKIILVSQDVQVRAAFCKAITNISDVRHYTAPAPASGQEDEVQKWIEKLESLK